MMNKVYTGMMGRFEVNVPKSCDRKMRARYLVVGVARSVRMRPRR